MKENLKMTGKMLMLLGTMCLMFVFLTRLSQESYVDSINNQIAEVTTIEEDVTLLMKDTFDIKIDLSDVRITEPAFLWESDLDTNFIVNNKMDSTKRKQFIKYAQRIIWDKETTVDDLNTEIEHHNRLVERYPTRWALPGKQVFAFFQL